MSRDEVIITSEMSASDATAARSLNVDRLIAGSDVETLGPPRRPGFGRSLEERLDNLEQQRSDTAYQQLW